MTRHLVPDAVCYSLIPLEDVSVGGLSRSLMIWSCRYSPAVEGQVVSLTSVSRRDSGPYLCIAANRVPPAVSRRVILQVTCQ